MDESSVGDNPPFDTEGIDLFDEDNDNDGLRNYDEINYDGDSIYTLGIDPDPLNPDTDGDGVLDGVEVHTDITDPLDPWDNLLDSDGDTINDYTELNTFYEKSEIDWDGDHCIDYCTDPDDADTDDDGCWDNWEIDGWSLKIFDHSTGYEVTSLSGDVSSNPLVRDMDGDGLLDGHEFMISDPTKEDTDGDHIKDNKEIQLKKLPTGVDNEPPKLTWSIQKIEENWLDGGLVNVKCSLNLDAKDYSGLEYVKIQLKTNGGSADTLESWSRGDSESPEGVNIFTTKKFYPINSYDVIFKAKDIDGHESWDEQHINSGWEIFANMAAEAAQSVWNYITDPIETWALNQIETWLEPIIEGIASIKDDGGLGSNDDFCAIMNAEDEDGVISNVFSADISLMNVISNINLHIYFGALTAVMAFASPFLMTQIIEMSDIEEILEDQINEVEEGSSGNDDAIWLKAWIYAGDLVFTAACIGTGYCLIVGGFLEIIGSALSAAFIGPLAGVGTAGGIFLIFWGTLFFIVGAVLLKYHIIPILE